MKHVVLIAAAALMCGGVAKGEDWLEKQPGDSTLHIESLGGEPKEFWTLVEHETYATFRCHYAAGR